ncbi:MAG: flagellar biosynthesis anti-sigma factor FlgM [Deltaproteobacteria bacterium]|nr:flagellar biosynthesis anti-sigma factor FlgM [Deltaproteobacteria bacterium]
MINKLQGLLNSEAVKEAAPTEPASKGQAASQPQPAAGVADTVQVSSRGRGISRIAEQVKENPEIRQDLVAKLKTAVDTGTYRVDSQDLATKMIKEMLMESLL